MKRPHLHFLSRTLVGAALILVQLPGGPLRAQESSVSPLELRGAIRTDAITPKPGRLPAGARFAAGRQAESLAWQPGDPIVEIPRRSYGGTTSAKAPRRTRVDALASAQRQHDETASASRSLSTLSAPIENWEGHTFSGSLPPDPTGAIGLEHFVQAVNSPSGSIVEVYDRSGSPLATFSMASLVEEGDCHDFARGDPIVLYDQLDHRWLLTEFTSLGNNKLCLYISDTNDPTGGWNLYEFDIPTFPDYPKYGVWPDGYYVGSNESSGPTLIVFDRRRILRGLSASSQRFEGTELTGFIFQMLLPADLEGRLRPEDGAPAIFARHNDDEAHATEPSANNDFIQLFELSVDWSAPQNTTLTGPTNVAISEFDSHLCSYTLPFECVPQPGTSTVLDALREPLMYRVQYRNHGSHESLVGNMVTDVDGSDQHGVRWFELHRSGGAWSLFQEGTYSPDTEHRWMGSIAMDADQNLALAFNLSSSTTFPGLFYTGREAGDATGVMTQGDLTIQSGVAKALGGRYGDYSQMSVDPVDDCTFWFTGEYSDFSGWKTRVVSFEFSTCKQEILHLTDWEDGAHSEWSRVHQPLPTQSAVDPHRSEATRDIERQGGRPYWYRISVGEVDSLLAQPDVDVVELDEDIVREAQATFADATVEGHSCVPHPRTPEIGTQIADSQVEIDCARTGIAQVLNAHLADSAIDLE